MVLPFVKLGTLALRTACKPIANRLKTQAGKHPKFRQLIIDFAQANHRITTTMQRRIYGHATDVEIRPLNEEKAVQAAADILGEFFVFAVAGAAVIFEVQRSARSEARKEEVRRQELEAIRQNNEDLARELEHLKQKLQELEQLAKGKGLSGLFSFRNGSSSGDVKSTANHSSENLKSTKVHSSEDANSTIRPSSGGAKLAAPAH
ncbi:Optic atrophy 3 protein (OPA3) [Thalictrum thalictroides]|uniref:Optic atrophy 3 protein (OPA3) n=1 Tax=Thalictrum thalictroides TaxID=46969 RepID=A0A7J6W3P5_THATH|nr:Optic atrophy 3 protein (OPA3) [Thalictrum thalictroides]